MKQTRRKKIRHRLEYLAFRMVVSTISAMSPQVCFSLARVMAIFVHRIIPKNVNRYHVAYENLKIAFGDDLSEGQIDRTIFAMWLHLFRMVTEIVHLPRKLRLENCSDYVQFRNREHSVKALCSGRPVLMLSGHFGNWEMATALFGIFGFHMGVVARDLDNPFLHEWFRKWRERTGHFTISKKGGGSEMVETLEQGGTLALLCDQDAGKKGLFVPFFGRDASTYKSIALLAMQYDAFICVGYAKRLPFRYSEHRWVRYEMGCEEVIDPRDFNSPDAIREMTLRYSQALERVVRKSPEQYFWVHRRWKNQPKAKRKRLQEKKAA